MMTKGASAVQAVDWDTVNLLRPFFDKGPDAVAARPLDFAMLRGAWAASVDSAGAWYDISGHGHTLTYNGNPTFNYDDLVPYWDYDGTGDYHSRADEPDLSITGTETYVAAAARGLTMGCWAWFDVLQASDGIMSKWGVTGVSGGYMLYIAAGPVLTFIVENAAGAPAWASTPAAPSVTAWHHVVGKFDPGAEIAIFLDGVKTSQATAIADIRDNAIAFQVGAWTAGGGYLDGRVSYPFLCAAALPDTAINVHYHMTKRYFGH